MKNEAHRQIVMYICQLTVRLLCTCYMSTHRQIVIHMLFVSSPLDCYTHAICQLTTRLLYTCYLSAQHHIVMHMLFISSPSDCYAHAIYHDQLIVRLLYTCYLSAYRQIVTCMLLVSSPSDCYAHVIYQLTAVRLLYTCYLSAILPLSTSLLRSLPWSLRSSRLLQELLSVCCRIGTLLLIGFGARLRNNLIA
jgi:hypothetical protein